MAEGPEGEGRLLAGFDAGQTHTTCRLARLQGDGQLQILGEGQGPGVSHLAASGGKARFSEALSASLRRAGGEAGWRPDLAAATVGASGIEQGTAVQERGAALAAAALGLPAQRVLVTGDERTALRGALGDRQGPGVGIVVISGTGCIALGRNPAGREHRCGGWGWLLDRSGSACDIGRDALALSLEMADGRRPMTPLRESLWSQLDLPATVQDNTAEEITAQRIKALVVDAGFGAAGFARLAPTVDALAAAGDPEARSVLTASARGLADLVQGVARALGMEQVRVCGLGGALTHLPCFAAAYGAELQHTLPGAEPVAARGDACDGALWLAADALLRPR
ncbi:N-acetylglucosamine kinase [Synechococcus sp. Tobar12-5m-g]|uniref:N-acetylglucosamine kinase n=1 Tax=unclassified Synechococcus TaxID=2626047 RepID=UPI0020CD107F|nr:MULTISPECIES: BadF/BadG/BcrA/BcrD ATPase family protein [unclassified Synechococcus]MCP9771910.1 N-acetylglucosamine kinase [Synechococcus sp. Tobar12-5m-g]MCP9872852.1 N-acetylglucosamine kinase [Synechococcus sp. Cruz CV-v-12]